MSCENMLEKMKKALLIPATEHYADDEILIHIASCRQLLVSAGIPRGFRMLNSATTRTSILWLLLMTMVAQ